MSKKNVKTLKVQSRVNEIYNLMLQGYSTSELYRRCTGEYNVNTRQIDVYIREAKNMFAEFYGEEYKKGLLEKQLAQLDDLYRKNYTKDDLRECRAIIEGRSKMLGIGELNSPDVSEITKIILKTAE